MCSPCSLSPPSPMSSCHHVFAGLVIMHPSARSDIGTGAPPGGRGAGSGGVPSRSAGSGFLPQSPHSPSSAAAAVSSSSRQQRRKSRPRQPSHSQDHGNLFGLGSLFQRSVQVWCGAISYHHAIIIRCGVVWWCTAEFVPSLPSPSIPLFSLQYWSRDQVIAAMYHRHVPSNPCWPTPPYVAVLGRGHNSKHENAKEVVSCSLMSCDVMLCHVGSCQVM